MFDLPHNNAGVVVHCCWVKICLGDWLFLASPWLPDGARYEQQRPITLAVREAASKQFCCSPHFRGGKIHLHSRGLTLLARGSIGSSKNEWGNGAVPHRPSVQYVVVVVVVVVTILVYYTTRFWNPHTTQRSSIGATGNRALKCPWRLLLRKTSEEEYTSYY